LRGIDTVLFFLSTAHEREGPQVSKSRKPSRSFYRFDASVYRNRKGERGISVTMPELVAEALADGNEQAINELARRLAEVIGAPTAPRRSREERELESEAARSINWATAIVDDEGQIVRAS
jgi:hypothetical protein